MTTVGIVGGGQLGRMLALAGRSLGIDTIVVEPGADPPAAAVAEVIRGPFDDEAALGELAARCDVVTVELEGVDTDALARLAAATGVAVHPSPAAVAVCADRLHEKEAATGAGLATAPYAALEGPTSLAAVGFPAFVKLRRGGFDGRGQMVVGGPGDVAAAMAWVAERPAVVEAAVAFRREVSVLGARSATGEVRVWPAIENVHADGQLHASRAPADAPGATDVVRVLLEALDHVGVLAVELFDTPTGWVVNELAPRVHNSGHWTPEGAETGQFEQHVRAILGWPLGSTDPVGESLLVNLIGELPPLAELLAVPGAHVHVYGKAPRAGRKLGHVTLVAPTSEALEARRAVLAAVLGPLPAFSPIEPTPDRADGARAPRSAGGC